MNRARERSGPDGFTLIELLVVIAIIGILASVVLASLNTARQKGRDTQRIAQVGEIGTALELYYLANGAYPTGSYDSRQSAQWDTFSGFLEPMYMADVPVDPTNNAGDGLMCGNCGEYRYSSSDGQGFIISTYLATAHSSMTAQNQYGPYYSFTSNCEHVDFWNCS